MSEQYNLIAIVKARTAEAYNKFKQFAGGVSGAKKEMTAFQKAGATAAGMLMRDMVNSLTSSFGEALKLGASMETLSASFNKLKGDVGDEVISLEKLRKATKGTVSDVDLLKAANNAMALGLPIDELDSLFGAAMDVGHAMGRDTLQAVNDLATGMGRQSKLILDNLGILVDTEQAHIAFAATLGKEASELTEAEKKAAFMSAAMGALRDKAEILEGTVSEAQITQERFNASMKNAKTDIGGMLGPLGAIGPILEGAMPLIGTLAGTLLPQMIAKLSLATIGTHALSFATGLLSAAQTVLNFILNLNPIFLIITAIGIIITLFGKWGDVVKFITGLLEGLWGWLKDIGGFFANLLGLGGKKEVKAPVAPERDFEYEEMGGYVPAQSGFRGMVTKPTMFLAGEGGRPEFVNISPGGARDAGGINVSGPLLNVEGSMDMATADYVIGEMRDLLKNVRVLETSSGAPATHKKIVLGGRVR